ESPIIVHWTAFLPVCMEPSTSNILLPFSLHLLKEIGVVLSPSYCVRMIGAKHLFINHQGALHKWLGLRILALICVEHCQGIQGGRSRGMLRSLDLLTDGQGTLVEQFCLGILCAFK